MKKNIKSINKLSFMEIYFRIISLLFWPIYWYKWIVITIENYNNTLFSIYLAIDGVFIILLVGSYIIKKQTSKRYFLFALCTSITYLVSLLSFMIFPINTPLLYLKIGMCLLLMVVSWKLIKEDLNDIGVVGLLAGILLLILTYFY
ncbi:hypothetical protein [Peptostreptococcus faecalis]|uniref:hypothetical protein n=1 Tax=Peptostreptococcus faecalis TaxID=2045015 RepID=UPI001FA87DA5|nr:hypothetical protein [Peptostreptococcus faecalis]